MVDITKFANPKLLWLLLLLLPMVAYYIYRMRQGKATMRISTVAGVRRLPHGPKYYLQHLPFVLRCLATALLIVALARPQSTSKNTSSSTEGIDIVLALDISGSMLARDFQPDRISAAKEMAANFIMDRPNDRIGLVVFAGEYHQADPVVRTVHDEIGGHLFRGRDPVGLEIPCQHTAGDVERQHDVDPLGRAAGVFRCALRAGQRHDQQRRRQASQNERQVLQVVFGPVRKPPYAGYGRYPHRSLPLPHPVDVIGDHRQQQQQQP